MITKLTKSLFVILAAFTIMACSESNIPQEGTHYTLLPSRLDEVALSPITEVFSLTCVHCWNMEQAIPEIESQTKQKVGKLHVIFNSMSQTTAFIYYAAEMQLGQQPDHTMINELFTAIQQKELSPAEKQLKIENIFISRELISPYKLNDNDMTKLESYMNFASTITEQAQINAVPNFIIAGNYLIIRKNHNDINHMINTINYLLSQ